jgi:hypothetical protein
MPVYSEKILRFCQGKKCPWGFRLCILEERVLATHLCNGEKRCNGLTWDIAGAARAVQWYLHLLERMGIGPLLGGRFVDSCQPRDNIAISDTCENLNLKAGEALVMHCRVRDGCMCMCIGVLRNGVWSQRAREACTVPFQTADLTALESILHGICHLSGYLVDRGYVE